MGWVGVDGTYTPLVAGGWLVDAPGVFEKLSLHEAVLDVDGHGGGHGMLPIEGMDERDGPGIIRVSLSLVSSLSSPSCPSLVSSLHRAVLNPVGPVTYRPPPSSFLLRPAPFRLVRLDKTLRPSLLRFRILTYSHSTPRRSPQAPWAATWRYSDSLLSSLLLGSPVIAILATAQPARSRFKFNGRSKLPVFFLH